MMMTVNLIAPQGWRDMSQEQLADMLKVMVYVNAITTGRESGSHIASMATLLCLLRWNGIGIVSPRGDGWILQRKGDEPFFATSEELAAALNEIVAQQDNCPRTIEGWKQWLQKDIK